MNTEGNFKNVEKIKTNGKIKKPLTATPKNAIRKDERDKSANKTPSNKNGKTFEMPKIKDKKKEEVKKTETMTAKKSNNNMSVTKKSEKTEKTEKTEKSEKTEKKEKTEKSEKKETKPAAKVEKKEGKIFY